MILSPVTDEPVYPSNVVFTTTNTKKYNLDKDHCCIRLWYFKLNGPKYTRFIYRSICPSLCVHSLACCVAATAVCAVRWCSAAGPVGGAASADGTLSQAGGPPRAEVASGPKEPTVSELPGRKQDLNPENVLSQLCLEHSRTDRSCPENAVRKSNAWGKNIKHRAWEKLWRFRSQIFKGLTLMTSDVRPIEKQFDWLDACRWLVVPGFYFNSGQVLSVLQFKGGDQSYVDFTMINSMGTNRVSSEKQHFTKSK